MFNVNRHKILLKGEEEKNIYIYVPDVNSSTAIIRRSSYEMSFMPLFIYRYQCLRHSLWIDPPACSDHTPLGSKDSRDTF